jgi:hypothetical protein
MRLPALFPALLLAPAGLIVYGLTAQRNLHWMGFFAGVAMDQFASYFYFTFTLAYAVDSYYANTSEMLIAMNLGKQAISFGMGSYLLDWILTRGYAVVISGIFGGVLLVSQKRYSRTGIGPPASACSQQNLRSNVGQPPSVKDRCSNLRLYHCSPAIGC